MVLITASNRTFMSTTTRQNMHNNNTNISCNIVRIKVQLNVKKELVTIVAVVSQTEAMGHSCPVPRNSSPNVTAKL